MRKDTLNILDELRRSMLQGEVEGIPRRTIQLVAKLAKYSR